MVEDFDAYRKWLGIPPKEQPPHHYRLLGIAPFEDDPDVIQNAADRQMAHVRTFQTGKHGAQSQKLLNELAAARGCLLDRARKSDYDLHLRLRLTGDNGTPREEKPEPVVATAVKAAPPPPPPAPPLPPPARFPVPPVVTAAVAVSEEAADLMAPVAVEDVPQMALPASRRLARVRAKQKKNALPLIVGGAVAGLLVLLAIGFLVTMGRGPASSDDAKGTAESPKKPDVKPPAVTSITPKPTRSDPPKPTRIDPPRIDPVRRPFPERPETGTVDTRLPSSPTFTSPTANSPNEPPPGPNATPAERVTYELNRARAALGRRDVEEAKRRVIDAEYAAKDDATKKQVAHMKALCGYLEEFWNAVRRGVYKMKPGESVQSVLGYHVEFLKVEGETVTYKSAGNQHTDKITDIRTSAATVFAKREMGDSPHAQFCVVAFLLVDHPPGFTGRSRDLQRERVTKAKEIYEALTKTNPPDPALAQEISGDVEMLGPNLAVPGGTPPLSEEVPELPPLPAGPNLNPPGPEPVVDKRTPVPDDRTLAETRKRLYTKYGSTLERVRTPDQKLDFLKQLRTDATAAAAEPVWQYVLLDKARDLYVEVFKPDLMLEVIDEMGQTFAIDIDKEKLVALNRCFLANNSPDDANTIHPLAYRLFRDNQAAKRYILSESFGDLAQRTARRARDNAAERVMNEQLPPVKKLAAEANRFEQMMARLKVDPADVIANTFVGRHYCLVDENWPAGLPYYLKGGDGDLKDAAAADHANPAGPSDRAVVGDRWFKLGRAVNDETRAPLLRRAKYWYELALPQLTGGERTVAEERLKEIEALLPLSKSF